MQTKREREGGGEREGEIEGEGEEEGERRGEGRRRNKLLRKGDLATSQTSTLLHIKWHAPQILLPHTTLSTQTND